MAVQPFFREGGSVAGSGNFPDTDTPGVYPEDSLSVPWTIDPEASYIDYRCWVEVKLDAGMTLHKALPQSKLPADTLAGVFFTDRNIGSDYATTKDVSVNLKPKADLNNIVQRMASSEFRFILKGWALRAGYKIPIPGLVSVGAASAVPAELQTAYNCIVGNMSGVPLWFATWEMHYYVSAPLGVSAKEPIPPNPPSTFVLTPNCQRRSSYLALR